MNNSKTYKVNGVNGRVTLKKQSRGFLKKDQATFYANVRIDSHIKNKAEVLAAIGLYKTQKEAIDEALDYLINSFPSEDESRLKF